MSWADEFEASDISTSGTTKNHVTCTSTAGTNASANVCNDKEDSYGSGTASMITGSANSNPNSNYIEIKAASGYKLVSPITIDGVIQNNSDKTICVVYWEGDYSGTEFLDWENVTFPNRKTICDEASTQLTFTGTVRTIRLYKQLYINNDGFQASSGTGKTQGGNTNLGVTNISASATLIGSDETAPVLSSSLPANNATNVAISGNIVLTFDENVALTSGYVFTLKQGETTVKTWDDGGENSEAIVSAETITLAYSGLSGLTKYSLQINDASKITDVATAHNAMSSISLPSFTTTDTRTALTLTFTATETTLEAGGATQATSFSWTEDSGSGTKAYVSSDPTVASVSSEGVITPLKAGSTTITATATPSNLVTYKPTNTTLDITVKAAATNWDFTSVVNTTYDYYNLVEDAKTNSNTGTKWVLSSSKYGNKSAESNVSLVANGKTLTSADGLLFTFTSADAFRYDPGNSRAWVNGDKTTITIPGLKKGDVIRVGMASSKANTERGFDLTNLTPSSWKTSSTSATQTWTATVNADGDVTMTGNGGCYLYKIEIFKKGITIGSAGWSTFVCDKALDFTGTSVSAYLVLGNEGALITKSASPLTTVPANTPLLLQASAGTYSIPVIESSGTDVTNNKLHAGGVTADEMVAAHPGCTFYRLAWDGENASSVGFYWGADDGAAFALAAGKAYLALNSGGELAAPSVIRIFDEENTTTSVENVEQTEQVRKFIQNGQLFILRDGITYDALGRRVK